jgi:hypothetical protein
MSRTDIEAAVIIVSMAVLAAATALLTILPADDTDAAFELFSIVWFLATVIAMVCVMLWLAAPRDRGERLQPAIRGAMLVVGMYALVLVLLYPLIPIHDCDAETVGGHCNAPEFIFLILLALLFEGFLWIVLAVAKRRSRKPPTDRDHGDRHVRVSDP